MEPENAVLYVAHGSQLDQEPQRLKSDPNQIDNVGMSKLNHHSSLKTSLLISFPCSVLSDDCLIHDGAGREESCCVKFFHSHR